MKLTELDTEMDGRKRLTSFINNEISIPSSPQILPKLQGLLRDPDSDLSDMVTLLKMDVAISAQVLKLANSSYFDLMGSVQGLEEAVHLIGFKEIFKIVSLASTKDLLYGELPLYASLKGELFSFSIASAQIMSAFAEVQELPVTESYYTCGLLHGLGKIILDQYYHLHGPVLEEGSFEDQFRTGNDVPDVERRVFGVDNAEAAGILLEKWQFPEDIKQPIINQYHPDNSSGHRYITTALSISREMAPQLMSQSNQLRPKFTFPEVSSEFLAWDDAFLQAVMDRAQVLYKEIQKMLQ